MIRVQTEDFDLGAELKALTAGNHGIGGLCSFVGLVRDMAGGEAIGAMTLEHYPGMTEKQLEEIVEQLELGNVNLEKSVELYERGIELKKICEEKLKKVDLQIRKIKLENNKITKEEFN